MTREWLLEAIRLATQLGFWDDVTHWKNELKQLEQKDKDNGQNRS